MLHVASTWLYLSWHLLCSWFLVLPAASLTQPARLVLAPEIDLLIPCQRARHDLLVSRQVKFKTSLGWVPVTRRPTIHRQNV